MRIDNDTKLDYSDVLLRPKRSTLSSRSEVDLTRQYTFKNGKTYSGVPVVASNMDGVGTFSVARALKEQNLLTCLVKTISIEEICSFFNQYIVTEHVCISIGITDSDFDKLSTTYDILKGKLKYVCIDVANGYSQRFVSRVKEIRDKFPELVIIAGNVVTGEMVEELLLAGADVVKVGIGSGQVCTTRIKTGVGYPQFSAIVECADAAHGLGGLVMADGGCTTPGDVAKAFCAGADFVMLGSMLAGHHEGEQKVIQKDGERFIEFYGMSSRTANDKHFNGLKDYRSSEGRTVHIPYKGSIVNTVQDILGGVRSCATYIGASNLKNMSKCATFIRVNNTHSRVMEPYTIGQ